MSGKEVFMLVVLLCFLTVLQLSAPLFVEQNRLHYYYKERKFLPFSDIGN